MARAVDTSTLPRETVEAAVDYIAENLREADQAELRATTSEPPADVLRDSWGLSARSWLILDSSNLPIGMMGVAPHGAPGLGIAWMLGTDGVVAEAGSIARQTRHYVAEMHELYPTLWNYIDARNELSLRWLEWSGFQIIDAHLDYGPEKRLFYEFARTQT